MAAPDATYFERAVELTLDYEGEQSDHPKDPGGFTRFGIAQRWHMDINVAALSRADAVDLLEARYWFPIHGELLPWPLSAALFDWAVHSGPGEPAEALQRAVGATPDRVIGPLTRGATMVAWKAPRHLLVDLMRRRARELARERQPDFIAGWMARVADLSLFCGYELAMGGRRALAA